MEIDALVHRLMDMQEEREPDKDAGDLSIEWQDDMGLVTVTQDGRQAIGMGRTAEQALRHFASLLGYDLG